MFLYSLTTQDSQSEQTMQLGLLTYLNHLLRTHFVLKWSFTFAPVSFIDYLEVCLFKVHLIEFFKIQDFHS